MDIAAGVVVYNPENVNRFIRCLMELSNQFERVYVFDNSSKVLSCELPNNIIYMTEYRNLGIAYALNRIMEAAKRDGKLWLVTMDQDSIIPDNLINEYKKAIETNTNANIGIICPQVIDKRRSYMKIKDLPQQEFINFCITSASCTSIKAWEEIGGFDEWLFIDLVDNDFCKRLVTCGYKILRLNTLVLNQEFGKIIPKSYKVQKFWIRVSQIFNNKNFAKFSYEKIVNPKRVYYTCRNIVYLNRKLSLYGRNIAYRDNYNCNSYMGFVVSFILPSILRAQDKIAVLVAVINGTKEGYQKKVEKWLIPNSK